MVFLTKNLMLQKSPSACCIPLTKSPEGDDEFQLIVTL